MDLAYFLLIIGVIFLIIDLIIILNKNRISKFDFYSNVAVTYGTFFILASYLIFIYNMLILNYSYNYVYRFASNDMDLLLRLSATWSSREGSYFLWSIFTLFLLIGFRLFFRKFMFKSGIFFYKNIKC